MPRFSFTKNIRILVLLAALAAFAVGSPIHAQSAKTEPFRILISNDDGIDSEGIFALARELEKIASVTVVAPEDNFSGTGHALTIKGPLTVSEVKREGRFFGLKVNATPATCVKLGLDQLCDQRPDLVVTGINEGGNLGLVLPVSGTFNAAQEGAMKGIPAIALSLERGKEKDYSLAAEFAREFITAMRPHGFPADAVININIPGVPREELKGVALTRLSDFQFKEIWVPRKTPWGQRYFWQSIKKPSKAPEPGTDWWAIEENMISISIVPLALDYSSFRHTFDHFRMTFNGKALTDTRRGVK